jgi:hypothetical protein
MPCRVLARRIRSSPSEVRGPVLVPPCTRHRPFCIAGDLHDAPLRVRAPPDRPAYATGQGVEAAGTRPGGRGAGCRVLRQDDPAEVGVLA